MSQLPTILLNEFSEFAFDKLWEIFDGDSLSCLLCLEEFILQRGFRTESKRLQDLCLASAIRYCSFLKRREELIFQIIHQSFYYIYVINSKKMFEELF